MTNAALIRSGISIFTTCLPYCLLMSLGYFGVSPYNLYGKTVLTAICTAISVWIGKAFCLALFSPVSKVLNSSWKYVYFRKGL